MNLLDLAVPILRQPQYWWVSRRYRIADVFRRIYHFHVRKTGGTSLNHMFLSFGGENGAAVYQRTCSPRTHCTVSGNKVFCGWNKRLIEYGNYFYAFSHLPAHEIDLPPQTFTMTCLRDPIGRVMSYYRMLLHYKVNKEPHPGMRIQGAWVGESFADFLSRTPKEYLLTQLFMFSASFDVGEAFESIARLNHVMFTESFDDGVRQLSQKLGIELQPQHTRKSDTSIVCSDDDIQRLREILEPEYRLIERLRQDSGSGC